METKETSIIRNTDCDCYLKFMWLIYAKIHRVVIFRETHSPAVVVGGSPLDKVKDLQSSGRGFKSRPMYHSRESTQQQD